MNQAHWHLAINHFPYIVMMTGTLILIGGIVMKNTIVNRAALLVIVAAGLFMIPTFLSGEGAEEIVELRLPDAKELIHEHEEHGEKALWTTLGVSLLALIALFIELLEKKIVIWRFLTLLAALINIGFLAIVNNSGGEISHPEIRTDYQQSASEGVENAK